MQQEPFLIDHELSFGGSLVLENLIETSAWRILRGDQHHKIEPHVFFTHLRQRFLKKQVDFVQFLEYLRVLNPDFLTPYHDQLTEHECFIDNFPEILAYLKEVRRKREQFNLVLQDLLS